MKQKWENVVIQLRGPNYLDFCINQIVNLKFLIVVTVIKIWRGLEAHVAQLVSACLAYRARGPQFDPKNPL